MFRQLDEVREPGHKRVVSQERWTDAGNDLKNLPADPHILVLEDWVIEKVVKNDSAKSLFRLSEDLRKYLLSHNAPGADTDDQRVPVSQSH